MTAAPHLGAPRSPHEPAMPMPSEHECAHYTKDMLDSLRSMALGRNQFVLASLLEAAQRETERLLSAAG